MDVSRGATPDLLVGLTTADIELDVPDMGLVRDERRTRTRTAMKSHNASVTQDILSEIDNRTVEDIAATKIQSLYRGHLGRKKYLEQLYNLFEKEEALRLEKTLQQVEEADLLVQNHQLEVEFDDNSTTRRNKSRHYLSHIITIQQAWQRYSERKRSEQAPSKAHNDNERASSPVLSETDDASDSSNGPQAMSVSSPEEDDVPILEDFGGFDNKEWLKERDTLTQDGMGDASPSLATHQLTDESPVSDYSEISESIGENLANVQFIQKKDLEDGNTVVSQQQGEELAIIRHSDETDEEFTKRVRKINYLSLAQEFAALKKVDASVLPFDIHKVTEKDLASLMGDSSLLEAASPVIAPSAPSNPSNTPTSNDSLSKEKLSKSKATRNKTDCNPGADSENVHGAHTMTKHRCASPGGRRVENLVSRADKSCKASNSNTYKCSNLPSLDTFHGQPSSGKKMVGSRAVGDFDVYNIETAMPQLNWDLLEEQLNRAAEEERKKKKVPTATLR